VATMTRVCGAVGVRCRSGQSKSARQVPGAPMSRRLFRWQGETGLHLEEIVVLASHHVAQSSSICDNGSMAILAIQTHHRLAERNRLGFHIRIDHLNSAVQLPAGIAEALVPKVASPLLGVCLENRRARPDHFTLFASRIAWGAHLPQPAVGRRQIRRGWQSRFSGGLAGAIDIEDQGVGSLPIPQPTRFLLLFVAGRATSSFRKSMRTASTGA